MPHKNPEEDLQLIDWGKRKHEADHQKTFATIQLFH